MHHSPLTTHPAQAAGWRLATFEVVWISLIFFLVAGSPPPDAGESHYLVKAKHYWNPAWCAGESCSELELGKLPSGWVP